MAITTNTWYNGWPIRTGSKGDVIDEWKATRIARKANHALANKVFVLSTGSYSAVEPCANTSNSTTASNIAISSLTDTEENLIYGYALMPYPANKVTLKLWTAWNGNGSNGTIKLYVGDKERTKGYDKYFKSNSVTITTEFWVTPSLGAPPSSSAGFYEVSVTRPFIPPNRVIFFRVTKTNIEKVGQWTMYAEYTSS